MALAHKLCPGWKGYFKSLSPDEQTRLERSITSINTINNEKRILFVLLKDFADWEGAYIAPNLNLGVEPGSESKYIVKTVSVRKEPVVSIGGFKVLPDYGIHTFRPIMQESY